MLYEYHHLSFSSQVSADGIVTVRTPTLQMRLQTEFSVLCNVTELVSDKAKI